MREENVARATLSAEHHLSPNLGLDEREWEGAWRAIHALVGPVLVVRDTGDVVTVSRGDLKAAVDEAGWGTKASFQAIQRLRAALEASSQKEAPRGLREGEGEVA